LAASSATYRAPTPTKGAPLSVASIRSILKKAGRQRNTDARAHTIRAALGSAQLSAQPALSACHGRSHRHNLNRWGLTTV
jgi:hypothetical protein